MRFSASKPASSHEAVACGKNIRVSSIYDPSADSITRTRELFPEIAIHESYNSLLAEPEIDWVMIGSWNSQHAEQAIQALEAGKHVFCEKPLATSLDDCLRVQTVLEAHPELHFFFGLVLRYSPHFQRIKQILDSGEIGKVISFEFNETLPPHHGGYIHGNWHRHRAHAGTHMLEKCCHDLEYRSGVRATFHTNCHAVVPERCFYICCSEGALRADALAALWRCGCWEVKHARKTHARADLMPVATR